jgi:hypothetical protein
MPITRKPAAPKTTQAEAVDVNALIAKGGSVAQAVPEEADPKEMASFTLRVPKEILATLDDRLKKQPYKVPRQQWILEAIVQRLEREILTDALPKEDRAP